VNFVTAHDGFTLQDLVSYDEKHNEANLEGNADGENHNLSWNCGVEGPTDDPAIVALRERQKRNFIATMLLSQGVPMLRGGDELSHTQQGNNNAYCQDNELSWLDWDLDEARTAFLEFCKRVIRLRRENGALRRRRFLHGHRVRGTDIKDIAWFAPSGREMAERDWNHPAARCLGVRLVCADEEDEGGSGAAAAPNTLMLYFNAHHEPVPVRLPAHAPEERWELLLDTADGHDPRRVRRTIDRYRLEARSTAVLRLERA
jgi:glycogen operon protein